MIIGKTYAIIEPSKAKGTANPFHERGLQVSFLACDRIVLKRKQSDKNIFMRSRSGQRDSIDRLVLGGFSGLLADGAGSSATTGGLLSKFIFGSLDVMPAGQRMNAAAHPAHEIRRLQLVGLPVRRARAALWKA